MLIEPSAMVIEGIGTQQVLRLLLVRACALHDICTKLGAFLQPDEEVVHMDIVIEHRHSFHSGPTTGQQCLILGRYEHIVNYNLHNVSLICSRSDLVFE